MAGPHVFGDGRLGVWGRDRGLVISRLPKLRAFGGGWITDVFLPRTATKEDKQKVLAAGFTGSNMWWARDDLNAVAYANRTLSDITRAAPGAGDLNIELAGQDALLADYIRTVMTTLRNARRSYRFRLVVEPFKGAFLPVELLQEDANLFVCGEVYSGLMERMAEDDVRRDLIEAGIPQEKVSVMYAAAVTVPGRSERVCGLPTGRIPRRGVIYHDDLMSDAGLI